MVRRQVGLAVAAISLIATACGASGAGSAVTSRPTTRKPAQACGLAIGLAAATEGTDEVAVGLADGEADGIKIVFNGRITVAGGSGTVKFKWVSSDGDVSPVATKNFTEPGSYEHSTSWTVDEATVPSGTGWSSIEIVDPVGSGSLTASPHASFSFTCDDSGFETIGFGIGGSDADCSIAKPARTFATTDQVRMVATWSPSLQAGTVVTFTLLRDGVVVDGDPVKRTYDVSTRCVHGNVSQGGRTSLAGHYQLEVTPDSARAISGEFDVK